VKPSSSVIERFRAQVRGFGPLGIFVTIVIVLAGNLIGAALALVWTPFTRTRWGELGFVRPRSWIRTVVIGVGIGIALRFLMRALLPLLGVHRGSAYTYLVGNAAALPGMIFTVVVGAGFGEETVWRGFLFHRLGKLMGSEVWARVGILALTSVGFGFAHLHDQGWGGVTQSTLTGLVFGALFLRTGVIFLPMVAHAVFDLAAVALIYCGRY